MIIQASAPSSVLTKEINKSSDRIRENKNSAVISMESKTFAHEYNDQSIAEKSISITDGKKVVAHVTDYDMGGDAQISFLTLTKEIEDLKETVARQQQQIDAIVSVLET